MEIIDNGKQYPSIGRYTLKMEGIEIEFSFAYKHPDGFVTLIRELSRTMQEPVARLFSPLKERFLLMAKTEMMVPHGEPAPKGGEAK